MVIRLALLNHLLAQRADLRDTLAHHAGRSAQIAVPPLRLGFTVGADGLLESSKESPAASITIAPWLLPRLALGDAAAAREVRLDGDAALAADLARVLQALDWDAEHDLARLIGDIPAHRLAETARSLIGDPRVIARNLAETTVEFLQDEVPLLATQQAVAWFSAEVDTLRDDVARMQKRLDRLEPQQS
ncbi:SCP2 domain-containing protein [Chitinimonas sp.]|uniref:ubiquinone biosynthesis accessory factor UbiJ n=1 Tax=Chitinimonas sp. TaxID=1934313 RepID=UPI0035AECF9A